MPAYWTPVAAAAKASPPAGPYSPAVKVGNLLFVSGQTPRDPVTGDVGVANIQAQTRRTLSNLESVLEACGASLADVCAVTVHLADENDWGAFNEVYREFFREPYPARTVVGAQLRGILVEVTAIAALGGAQAALAGGPVLRGGGGGRPDMTII